MYIHPRLLWVKSYANEGKCKQRRLQRFAYKKFQPRRKSRRSRGQVLVRNLHDQGRCGFQNNIGASQQFLVRNLRNKVNVTKTKINTFAPILVLVLATLKAVLLQLNGMLMKWKIQQAMQDDYMPSTPPEFIPLSSQ